MRSWNKAANYRTPVRIVSPTMTTNASRERIEDWATATTVHECMAQLEESFTMEYDQARKVAAEQQLYIHIRFPGNSVSITPKMRIINLVTLATYDIIGVMNMEGRDRRLRMLCRENLNG